MPGPPVPPLPPLAPPAPPLPPEAAALGLSAWLADDGLDEVVASKARDVTKLLSDEVETLETDDP